MCFIFSSQYTYTKMEIDATVFPHPFTLAKSAATKGTLSMRDAVMEDSYQICSRATPDENGSIGQYVYTFDKSTNNLIECNHILHTVSNTSESQMQFAVRSTLNKLHPVMTLSNSNILFQHYDTASNSSIPSTTRIDSNGISYSDTNAAFAFGNGKYRIKYDSIEDCIQIQRRELDGTYSLSTAII